MALNGQLITAQRKEPMVSMRAIPPTRPIDNGSIINHAHPGIVITPNKARLSNTTINSIVYITYI